MRFLNSLRELLITPGTRAVKATTNDTEVGTYTA